MTKNRLRTCWLVLTSRAFVCCAARGDHSGVAVLGKGIDVLSCMDRIEQTRRKAFPNENAEMKAELDKLFRTIAEDLEKIKRERESTA